MLLYLMLTTLYLLPYIYYFLLTTLYLLPYAYYLMLTTLVQAAYEGLVLAQHAELQQRCASTSRVRASPPDCHLVNVTQ